MSKLFNLKEWLTVAYAARHLSIVFGEDIDEADVLRLALDGRLRLSIYFADYAPSVAEDYGIEPPAGKVSFRHLVTYLRGVCDIPLASSNPVFANDELVERICHQTTGNEFALNEPMHWYVKDDDQRGFILVNRDRMPPTDHDNGNAVADLSEESLHHYGLPRNSSLVVRTAALRELEQSITASSSVAEKPLSTTERNTLLTIIAALCDYSAIKHQERGASSQIAKLTDELGAPVTDDTVRTVLRKIPGALETRMK